MGRSQLKYRSSRGGRGQHGGNHDDRGAGSKRGGRGNGRGGGGRPLGSNAFRYANADPNDGANDEEEDVSTSANPTQGQFFADERQYRDMGDVKESYFRTKAMEQWDVDGDDDPVGESASISGMDFAWIAEQLATVPVSIRYRIDPKYCEKESEADSSIEDLEQVEETDDPSSVDTPVPSSSSTSAVPSLDELLALSSTASAKIASDAAQKSQLESIQAQAPSASSAHVAEDTAELEDWLDDVLDA